MPIRIMHVVDHLGKGGLENGLVNLINGLDPDGFEHTVYAVRELGPNAERLPARVRVLCMGKRDTDFPVQLARLVRDIRKVSPDIVHSRNWGAVEAVAAARWTRSCAVVHSEHGLEADGYAKESWRRRWYRRVAFEFADRVLTVSYQLRDLHARRTGFSAGRIGVIHNGVDGKRFFPNEAARSRMRTQMGISPDEFCIGCVGNLLPVKDHMTVLRAIGQVAGVLRRWRLVIAGEGPERDALQAFLTQHPEWKGRVSLPGSSDRVPELLNALDVYILPSLAEGISNSLLEAMSTGLPVITTATGGNPEVVVDGESGLLFPVGDYGRLAEQLLMLEGNGEMRAQLAQQAITRVHKEFSIDSMVRNYSRLYEGLAQKRTAAAPVRTAARA
jgi:sugar transferase (PEP-CTERM/EpsH1 system associated)